MSDSFPERKSLRNGKVDTEVSRNSGESMKSGVLFMTTVSHEVKFPEVFLETNSEFPEDSEKMSDGFLTRIFLGIPQEEIHRGFRGIFFVEQRGCIKCVKSVDFRVFSRGLISRFQNPRIQIQGTHFVPHFRNFEGFQV
jgi:hypothetical protein